MKPNRYPTEQSQNYMVFFGFVDYPLRLFDYVRGRR
jgi:hypothetical protein